MKTHMASGAQIQKERKWFVVDLADKVLGRQATEIANILRGKHKPEYTPFLDCGDYVIVVNAEQVKMTGRKIKQKKYYHHTGYPGGIREVTAEKLLEKDATRVIHHAVKGMLPKGPLGRKMLSKLKIYNGPEHPHEAQQPTPLTF